MYIAHICPCNMLQANACYRRASFLGKKAPDQVAVAGDMVEKSGKTIAGFWTDRYCTTKCASKMKANESSLMRLSA